MSRSIQLLSLPILTAGLSVALFVGCGQDATQSQEAFPQVEYDSLEASLAEVDTELNVQLALLDNFGVDGMRVESEVVGNHVILGGTVHDPATQELAEGVVENLTGVESVDNRIVVAPSEDMAPEDEEATAELQQELADATLETRVRLALYGAIGLDAQHLEVEAVDGTVSVGGRLDSDAEKSAALATADATEGVTRVIDMVEVAQPVITEESS